MMRSVTAALTALVVFSAVVLSVHAGPISGTFNGNSTLTPIGVPGVFVQNFTGDGSDATYGAFILSSTSTIDFSAPPDIVFSDGSFLDIFSGGALFGTSSGSGSASGMGTASFTLDLVITGGTGIFAGDAGSATVTGTITSNSPTTEAISASYLGTLRTTVPEPATLALLGVGLAGLGLSRRKQ